MKTAKTYRLPRYNTGAVSDGALTIYTIPRGQIHQITRAELARLALGIGATYGNAAFAPTQKFSRDALKEIALSAGEKLASGEWAEPSLKFRVDQRRPVEVIECALERMEAGRNWQYVAEDANAWPEALSGNPLATMLARQKLPPEPQSAPEPISPPEPTAGMPGDDPLTAAFSGLQAAIQDAKRGMSPEEIKEIVRTDVAQAITTEQRKFQRVREEFEQSVKQTAEESGAASQLAREKVKESTALLEELNQSIARAKVPRKVEIKLAGKVVSGANGEANHEKFPICLTALSNKLHVYAVGPAGSGKTETAKRLAKALDVKFYPYSCHEEMSTFDLLGYMTASGEYVPGIMRKAFEGGGLFLLDEIDNGSANVQAALNAGLSNGLMSFPDKVVERHPDFYFMGGGNTWGLGADADYVGRNPLDAATLDRMVFVEFGYDSGIEESLTDNPEWLSRVRAVRESVARLGIRMVVSPRAVDFGTRLLSAGVPQKEVEKMVLWRGQPDATKTRVNRNVKEFQGV